MIEKTKKFTATRNPCKLCTPFGASIVFKGIKGAMTLLHGSQGCATYIRRYCISHFREPIDIASSNFSETTAIFGGKDNLFKALKNINQQYHPDVIGVATTCLSETIGDDIKGFLKEFISFNENKIYPPLVHVSTPSYSGTHMDGFHSACLSLVKTFCKKKEQNVSYSKIGIFINFISSEDIRMLKKVFSLYGLDPVIIPDYSETLDGGVWESFQKISKGGTSIKDIESLSNSLATFEFGYSNKYIDSAGKYLANMFKIPLYQIEVPIGVNGCDKFFNMLEVVSGREMPDEYKKMRERLIDSYSDAHKYIFNKKAIVYGEEDLVEAISSFLLEIGMTPIICLTGAKSIWLKEKLSMLGIKYEKNIEILTSSDFGKMEDSIVKINSDIMIGSSKGYTLSRKLKIPLVRVGFPIHDRIGAQRIKHILYEGTQELFDRIVNAIIEYKQSSNKFGYTYM